MIELTIPLKPISVNQAYRAIPRGRICTSIKSKQYRDFEKDCLRLMPQKDIIKGQLEIYLEFHIKRDTVSDVDNFAKVILDMITKAEYIEDDRFIYKLTLEKFKSKNEFINIKIKAYEEEN